jgi:tryptophan-rich sensory protein
MPTHWIRPTLVWIALLATLFVNYLSTTGGLNNIDTAAISDRYPVPFTPAGYVFSTVWSAIYLGLIAFGVYQSRKHERRVSVLVDLVSALFILSCLLNIGWLFAWHYDLLSLSVGLMLGLLVTLISIYQTVQLPRNQRFTGWEWKVRLPFRIYLGWISVATIANITIWLYALGFDGFGVDPAVWTAGLMFVAAGLAIEMIRRYEDYAFPAVIAWALIGIVVKQSGGSVIPPAGLLAALLIVTAAALRYFRSTEPAADTDAPVPESLPDAPRTDGPDKPKPKRKAGAKKPTPKKKSAGKK